MLRIGFEKSKYDDCVYIRKVDGKISAYLLLYVDDMLVAAPNLAEIIRVKGQLQEEFDMKDLGNARKILGMDMVRDRGKGELRLTQKDYLNKVLKKFQIQDSKLVTLPMAQQFKLSKEQCPTSEKQRREMDKIPYASIIGSIMYTMVCTRPDLGHAMSVVSRFMADPGLEHWHALKWLMRYLKGTTGYAIVFRRNKNQGGDQLVGFSDSDYAVNYDTRKSQSGYVFTLNGAAVSWKSCLQSVVALSTTEAEYISLAEAVKESFWLKGILGDFGVDQDSVEIKCDSASAIV